jgi:hypothetical protein
MVSHPVEANFYVQVSDAEVEVTFAPTRSRYIYSRLVDTVGLLSPHPVVRHVGRRCDVAGYEPTEVQAMAYAGLATMRRLMRSSARAASRRLVPGTPHVVGCTQLFSLWRGAKLTRRQRMNS